MSKNKSKFPHAGLENEKFLTKEKFITEKWVVRFFSDVVHQSVITFGTIKSLVQKILNVDADSARNVPDFPSSPIIAHASLKKKI